MLVFVTLINLILTAAGSIEERRSSRIRKREQERSKAEEASGVDEPKAKKPRQKRTQKKAEVPKKALKKTPKKAAEKVPEITFVAHPIIVSGKIDMRVSLDTEDVEEFLDKNEIGILLMDENSDEINYVPAVKERVLRNSKSIRLSLDNIDLTSFTSLCVAIKNKEDGSYLKPLKHSGTALIQVV
ncbi:hypothetical protein ECANGB1_735 [Enterospora canceri]|uniref:Uncharacterized protein n=1 Tax=Enterospora canceri TaxID=1081671 RepID=A0A1Y1S7K1_9MICR|nr:hypothetical protein ECANGB1_735 [Enterospora canceri]